jgi:outer membrane receptor protein involved in Fe transport
MLVVCAAPARAQPPDDDEPVDEGEIIVVEETWPGVDLIDPTETPRAVTVVDPEPAAGDGVLGDALGAVPGVAVQRTGPGQGSPIVRGLIGSAVLVMVDGMRLNDALFRPAPNQINALVDPWSIDRIEVVRGPGSTAFGSDALGGVIHVITPLPRFDGDAWQDRAVVAGWAASADRSVGTRAEIASGRAGSGLAAGVTLHHHGDLRTGGGRVIGPAGYDTIAVDATGHLERGRRASTAWLTLVEQPSLPRTDEMLAGFGQDEPAAAVYRYQPSRRTVAHVRHLIRRPSRRVEAVEVHAAWQGVDDGRRIQDTGAPDELIESNRDDGLGLAARATVPTRVADLIAGADAWHDVVSCRRWTRVVATGAAGPTSCRYPDGSTMSQSGGFVEARRAIGPLQVRGGLRAGVAAVRIAAQDIDGDATPAGAVDTADWAGELGAELDLGAGVALASNLGRSFRSPNVHDLSGLGPRPGDRYQVPAADLGSEHALGADLGVRIARDAITAELFGFGLIHQGRIDVAPTGELRPDGREVVASANLGTTWLGGVESSLAASLSRLTVTASLTWTHGAQRGAAGMREPADRVPPLHGAGFASLRLGGVVLDAGVRAAAPQRRLSARDRVDPRIDPMGTDAWATLHAGAAVRLGDFDVALRVDNLLDARYREHASGTDAPGLDAGLLVRWQR